MRGFAEGRGPIVASGRARKYDGHNSCRQLTRRVFLALVRIYFRRTCRAEKSRLRISKACRLLQRTRLGYKRAAHSERVSPDPELSGLSPDPNSTGLAGWDV